MNDVKALLARHGLCQWRAWTEAGQFIYLPAAADPRLWPARSEFPTALIPELSAAIRELPPPAFPAGSPDVGAFPLLPQQEYMFRPMEAGRLAQMAFLPVVLRLRTTLDGDALSQTFRDLCQRHSVFRGRLGYWGEMPVQYVDESHTVTVETIDVSAVPEAIRESEALRLASDFANAPMNLAQDFMLRAAAIRLSPADHLIVASMPHVISDGLSVPVLSRELRALYTAYSQGKGSPLTPLPVQFFDYALWRRQSHDSFVRRDAPYWRAAMAGTTLSQLQRDPNLSADTGEFDHGYWSAMCPDGIVEGVRQLNRKTRSTVFMATCAALAIVLHYASDSDDILLDMTMGSRTRPELADLIGLLTRITILRIDMRGNPTLVELVARAKNALLNTMDHADLTQWDIREIAGLDYQPLFLSHSVLTKPTRRKSDPFEPVVLPEREGQSPYFFAFLAVEIAGQLSFNLFYQKSFFRSETINHYMGGLNKILGTMAAAPETRLSDALALLRR